MSALNAFENSGNDGNQFFGLERLRNIRINACAETCNAISGFILRSQKHDRNEARVRGGAEISSQLVSVHTRHADIANDQIGQSFGDTYERFRAASSSNDNVSLGP